MEGFKGHKVLSSKPHNLKIWLSYEKLSNQKVVIAPICLSQKTL